MLNNVLTTVDVLFICIVSISTIISAITNLGFVYTPEVPTCELLWATRRECYNKRKINKLSKAFSYTLGKDFALFSYLVFRDCIIS